MSCERSYEDALKLVCLICVEKASRLLTKGNLETLGNFEAFQRNRSVLPSAICDSCRQKLKKGECGNQIDDGLKRFAKLMWPRCPESRFNSICTCVTCKKVWAKFGRDQFWMVSAKNEDEKVLLKSHLQKRPESELYSVRNVSHKLDPVWITNVTRTQETKTFNIYSLRMQNKKYVGSVIKHKLEEPWTLKTLTSGGKKFIFHASKSRQNDLPLETPFTHDFFEEVQEELGLSDRSILSLASSVRRKSPKGFVEPNLTHAHQAI